MKRLLHSMLTFATLLATTLTSPGCAMFRPTITPHPDAPILITNTFGPFLKAAVYDKSKNALVPAGWFYLSKYDGYTLHKFNWQTCLER